ncbi:bactericidal permeability-increasing protein-like [Chanos chanos]|uniref:Bactericidal permeability-increasing protein n=1 Tax=Chanos chanos TaxID=29144 RepID=A0A6J2WB43_CHACN|nr:bactericidal permeability-increasing protein-like [Chanos chanos]
MWLIAVVLMTLSLASLGAPSTHVATEPGIRVALTQEGLNKVSHDLTGWFQERISSIHPPGINGTVPVWIGAVRYFLTDMSVVRCDLPEPQVSYADGQGITVVLDGLSMHISGKWRAKLSFLSTGGTFDLAIFNVQVKATLKLGSDKEGHLSVTTGPCVASAEKICSTLDIGVQELDRNLTALPVQLPVGRYVFVAIPLTNPPTVKGSHAQIDAKGAFYSRKNATEPPFSPDHFNLTVGRNRMIYFGASEFCVNTATFAYFTGGLLQINITDDMIPAQSPIQLNTSDFGELIPELPRQFPNELMTVRLRASQSPRFSLQANLWTLDMWLSADTFAIQPNSTLAPLFTLDLNVTFSGKALISDGLLKGSMKLSNVSVSLGSSHIGPFSINPLQVAVNNLFTDVLLPQLNKLLQVGFKMPTVFGYSMVNAQLTIDNGFVSVSTDILIK